MQTSEARRVRGYPVIGVLPDLIRHPAEYCRELMVRYDGSLLRVNIGAGSFYLATRPEHLEHILSSNSANYWKGRIFNRIRFVFGEGLLLSEGEEWKAQRRAQQPAFNPRRLRALVPLLSDLIAKRLSRWESAVLSGDEVDVADEMRRVTMSVGAAAMFSEDVSEELIESIGGAFDLLLKCAPLRFFTFFLPEWIKVPGQRRTESAMARVDRFVSLMAEARREKPERHEDLLSLLSAAVDADSQGRSREQAQQRLRDNVVTTLFAGYESTATALTWIWCLLARHPAVTTRVQEEVDAVLGARQPNYEDLQGLEYTQMVIDESLRLYPPFWESFRSAHREDCIEGVRIPAGASFLICPYATQRDPRIWPNPDVFDPERFRRGREARHRYAYFPFLEGQRACIGKGFALTEIKLVIAMIVRRYHLNLRPGYVLESKAEGTLRPRNVPWMRVSRR